MVTWFTRRAYAAFTRGEVTRTVRLLSREAELEVHTGRPPQGFVVAGDRVLVALRTRVRGRASGVDVETHPAHVWRIRRGEAVRLDVYNDKEEALQALRMNA